MTHGMGWILVAIGFALLGFAPGIIDRVATYLGIEYPPVLALTLGIAILVLKILMMDIEHSHLNLRNQRLIQRVAMLEADLKSMTGYSTTENSNAEDATPELREQEGPTH